MNISMRIPFMLLSVAPWDRGDPIIDLSGSEFIDNLLQKIFKSIYQGLWDGIEMLFEWMGNVQNDYIESSRNLISQTPQQWNHTAFLFIRLTAQNAAIPIAGCIITFVFCWQLVSMMQESNQMHSIKPETMLLLMLKLGICLLVCSKSFEIVNGMFDLAAYATSKIPIGTIGSTGNADLGSVLSRDPDTGYSFGACAKMVAYWFITLIAVLITYVISITIYIRANMWYLELLVYASAAPIPFATFMNKEWGQVGNNYLRKMLAMSFEGFLMIVMFGLYQALTTHILSNPSGNGFLISMVTTIGCGIGLIMIINKAGTISASIFNAH